MPTTVVRCHHHHEELVRSQCCGAMSQDDDGVVIGVARTSAMIRWSMVTGAATASVAASGRLRRCDGVVKWLWVIRTEEYDIKIRG